MKDWIQQHRVSAALSGLTVLIAAQLWVSVVIGTTWSDALLRILINAVMSAGFLYLVVRYDRRQKASLATQGILVHVRRPGSRPGSLDDLWAGGTATCSRGQLVFQEAMSGTDISLGKPVKFDVVAVTDEPRNATRAKSNPLPANLTIQTFVLPGGTVQVAADADSLARINEEVFSS
ncbi:hypothetical protein ART_0580 [Arthrobacter sp. PAMC 25486]|uniref:hypothetical protein n=1 Tax=Arthrobacter sp. PAMC 25486 TaxID=1494608 RepID=UPI0005360748|nr:hypothetical protein [Arthrobacter sp. PAMC 25486]AIY00179.1 hypothetical protein ART_0580 [Arthrobacter sp. PAMC 25486]